MFERWHAAMKKRAPGCLGYVGDYTDQLNANF